MEERADAKKFLRDRQRCGTCNIEGHRCFAFQISNCCSWYAEDSVEQRATDQSCRDGLSCAMPAVIHRFLGLRASSAREFESPHCFLLLFSFNKAFLSSTHDFHPPTECSAPTKR
jgi:hypothetical protein